ncbi:hypothetical protein [Nocardia aurantia]|uniref:Uncharacterized protein n=1 Tax=Nocardia aurantia TaxID=2585199 RepID=A0A7K0DZR7_9NOCA|nr:hypothetical protein [Nocardia aurantia]MQY31316.1 hypothetical protein [Nocardia aurantia]
MKLTLFVADSAQIDASGKLNALGLGWDQITTPTPPISLVIFVDFEVVRVSNDPMPLTITCLDTGNEPVKLDAEGTELRFRGELNTEAGALRALATVNLAPGLPLSPGAYRWIAALDGTDVSAALPFKVIRADTAISTSAGPT